MSARKQHILHIIDSLAPGGGERVLVEIANATDKSQYRVSICVTRSNLTLAGNLDPQVSFFSLDRHYVFDMDKFRRLASFCAQENVHLIQVHMRSSFLLICTLRLLHIIPAIPIIFHDHYGDVEFDPNFPLLIQVGIRIVRPYYVGVHPVLTCTAIKSGVSRTKARTIANAIDFSKYTQISDSIVKSPMDIPIQKPVGVIVANIRPTKNHFFLFKALYELRAEPWTMLLVGGAADSEYLAACQHYVAELGLATRIIFLGTVTQVSHLLSSMDFGVLTSRSESGPLVLLEYIASRVPFVSTRVGAIGKALHQMEIPALVEPDDFDGFVESLRELICIKTEDRVVRVENAWQRVKPQFDIHTVINDWHMLYNSILEAHA